MNSLPPSSSYSSLPDLQGALDLRDARIIELETALAKAQRINQALMDRVERSTDLQGNAFSLFETAIILEAKVRDRTADLECALAERLAAEAGMREAKMAAEEANISKTRFLAAASHDLLQPLSAARLFVSAIADRRLAPPTRKLIHQAESALDSVEDLLEALLEISKLDAGAIVPQPANFALADLLKSMMAEFGPIAQARGLALTIPPCPLWVHTDMRLARRILQNLVANAVQYTEAGYVELLCTAQPGSVRIEVHDTGIGIAPEHQTIIFEEFRRLSDRRRDQGVGLGLAIVQRAARILGIDIGLQSTPGRGSIFWATFPAATPCPDMVLAHTPSRSRPPADRAMLIIDNEITILDGMAAMLNGWGYHTTGARGVCEALAALDAGFTPDMIIADYHLDHGETGDMAVHTVRGKLSAPVPAIIITADRTPELREKLITAGFDCLTKPVKPAQLRALLSRPDM